MTLSPCWWRTMVLRPRSFVLLYGYRVLRTSGRRELRRTVRCEENKTKTNKL